MVATSTLQRPLYSHYLYYPLQLEEISGALRQGQIKMCMLWDMTLIVSGVQGTNGRVITCSGSLDIRKLHVVY